MSTAASRLSSPSRPGLAFRHLLPSRTEAKSPRAGPMCETWPLCPHVPPAGGGAARRPRQRPAPCTHPTASSCVRVGIAAMEPGTAPVQRQQLHALSLQKFPLPSVAAISGKSGGALSLDWVGVWVLLEHAWSALCACPGTHVSVCQHMCVSRSECVCGETATHTQKCPCASLSRHCTPVRLQHPFCCSDSQHAQPNELAQQS